MMLAIFLLDNFILKFTEQIQHTILFTQSTTNPILGKLLIDNNIIFDRITFQLEKKKRKIYTYFCQTVY